MWGEADGQIRWHPDEAVTGVIATIFDRFAVCGSVRGVWLWLREQGLRFPLQPAGYLRGQEITWVEPTYHAVHNVLTHPAYAGAYVFGKTRQRRHLDAEGVLRTSRHKLPQGEWEVLIPDHHRGFLDWDTYQANQARIGANTRPRAHQPGTGAVREGCALLQGLATCGTCGRKLAVYYDGPAKATPGYYCTGTGQLVDGRGTRHLRVGGVAVDTAVAAAFLAALAPSALQACLAAAQQLEDGHDTALAQWRRQVEQARYHAGTAERRYRAVDPDNRLVARGLETEWNTALHQLADAENELARRETARPTTLTPHEKQAILALGDDLAGVWSAATTTDKDRKKLLRTLLGVMTAPSVIAPVVPRSHLLGLLAARDGGAPRSRTRLPLPVPPPQRTTSVVYGAAAVDDRGRVVERVVLRALGWPAGHRLSFHGSGGMLTITPDPTGEHQVTNQGFLRLPAELRHRCGLAIGERVLLAADPERSLLTLYTPAALDAVLHQSSTRSGGDPA